MDKNDTNEIRSPDTATLQNDDYATEESNELTQSMAHLTDMMARPSSSSLPAVHFIG